MLHVVTLQDACTMGRKAGGSMETSHGLSATAPTRARTAEIAGPVAAAAEMGLTAQAALQLASTTWALGCPGCPVEVRRLRATSSS